MGRFALITLGIVVLTVTFTFSTQIEAHADQGKPVELTFGSFAPPQPPGNPYVLWATELEKRTNGRVKTEFYWSGSLVGGLNVRVSLLKQVADVSFLPASFDASAYPLNMVFELPVMGWPEDFKIATRIRDEVTAKFPELQAEFKGTKVLWARITDPTKIHSSKKPIRLPEDVKGMKIAGFGMMAKMIKTMGGKAIALGPGDMYMALDRGVVEAVMAPYHPLTSMNMQTLTPYHADIPFCNSLLLCLMSGRTWKGLSPDVQDIIDELGPWAQKIDIEKNGKDEIGYREVSVKLNHTFFQPTQEEMAIWKKKLEPMHEEWIAKNEKKGHPAKAIYNEIQRLIKEYSK